MMQSREEKVRMPRHQLAPPSARGLPRKVQRTSNLSSISIPCSVGSVNSVTHSDTSCTVQREQYWMCSRRTRLEKILMLSCLLLCFIIVGLVIGLAVLASDDKSSPAYHFFMNVFHPLASLHRVAKANKDDAQ
ncbi:uncharacterized protein LOC124163652 [Ischnura elegans]|uniref:uncharacterized protein LOC124163652 n=1 Tax=Ischnura elegans TaxID=197161 RepID=UPI001ED8A08F|nr:uncharacterized protein LOC124163652 [Ischnura elegans]